MATIIGRHKEITALRVLSVGEEFAVDKAYHAKLAHRQNVLLEQVDRRTAIHTTLVTTYGLKYNEYSGDFTNVVTLDHLFA